MSKDDLSIIQSDAGLAAQIVHSVSVQLTKDFGRGFSYTALTRMGKFPEVFSEPGIVATLSQQLAWSHFKEIIPLKDDLQCDFYAEMCRVERWNARTLRRRESIRLNHPGTALLEILDKIGV